MKSILVLLASFAFSATAASAQTVAPRAKQAHAHKVAKTPEQRADHAARHLTQSLQLTADQTAKVRQLYLTQAQEKQAYKAKYATADKAQKHEAMKVRRAKYDAQLKQILNADQYAKFSQERAEHMNKRKDKMKGKS